MWRERERERFTNGTYRALPVLPEMTALGLAYPESHYLHLSVTETESDTVAYTASESHGEADRQTRIKFGRYLKKTFPQLTDQQIQSCVVALRAALNFAERASEYSLHFATDTEMLNEIFETPMCPCDSTTTSCMHGKFRHWEHRPYHVYAGSPDVAVAYLRDGSIVARTVVSVKHKQFIRLYAVEGAESHCLMLKGLLAEQGYKAGSLVGNRLSMLPKRDGEHVLPYLDGGVCSVCEDDGFWLVDPDGEYAGDRVDGYATADADRCDGCGCASDSCECYYCECCEERYADGCDRCLNCEYCEGCREHGSCDCNYCSSCDCLVSPRYGWQSRCTCERCAECGELVSEDCSCETCEDCGELLASCECEDESTESEVKNETIAS